LESSEQFATLRGSIPVSAAQQRTGRAVCQLQPLPETAVEANTLAAKFGIDHSMVMVGDNANEASLREMSSKGELRRYRNLLFATHGLVSGELQSGQEPALVLTPVNGCAADAEPEDGLLSSSDIMNLSLDADWVVLSACNTAAASSGANVRPLSGLARAFFFAGARGVIASYWSVDSQSVVDLIGETFSAGNTPQKHLALTTAMRKMRRSLGEQSYRAHPAFWAPFVIVGDIRR
jgi:CHAT domain-containing protein